MSCSHSFDICLMNPPYDRSLHLKFLEKAIKVADNVVSVQPIRWLQEVLSKSKSKSYYNKYKTSISSHIKDLDIINSHKAKSEFGVQSDDLGIYVCDNNGGFNYDELSENSIIDKVIQYTKENKCSIEMDKKDGYRVRVPIIISGRGGGSGTRKPNLSNVPVKDLVFKDGKLNGKWWYEYYQKNQHSKTTEEITSSIRFNSEEEGHNFVKTLETDFVRYVESFLITDVNISNEKILWMGNAKNPRTGKTGYKSEWTNEDFYEFFDVSEDEQKQIKSYLDKNKADIEAWEKANKKR